MSCPTTSDRRNTAVKIKAVNTSQTTRALNLNAIILFYKCREK